MEQPIRYRKPPMAGLPPEVGAMVFRDILSMTPLDMEKLKERTDCLREQMIIALEQEKNDRSKEQ